jgi:ABC-type transport system involved in multi-copper enzyme maturation permease subunit
MWLRWKLTQRGFTRSRSTLIGSIIGLVFLGPYALALAGALGYGLFKLNLNLGEHTLRAALLFVAGIWTVGPLLGFQLNEAQDITRLFVYPVPVRKLFLGAIAGCLLDLTTILLLPTLIAVIVGAAFHGVAGALVAAVAMPLFLFQTLAASQAVTLALQGILQSRKWRDVALIIVPLFWMVWQLGMQSIGRGAGKVDWKAFLVSTPWEAVSFLPSGLAARAVGAGMKGMWPLAIAYLGALGLVTVATFTLSAWLVGKAYEGDAVGVPAPKPSSLNPSSLNPSSPGPSSQSWEEGREGREGRFPLLPGSGGGAGGGGIIGAIFQKEWRVFTRDPYFRLMAMNFIYMLGFGVFMSFNRGKGGDALGFSEARTTLALWLATSLTLFQQSILSYNIFGPEANAATLLFAFPTRRRELLIGKNLANLSAILPLNVGATVMLCLVLKRLDMLVLLLPWMVCASVLLAAVGNAVSVMIPYRVNTQGLKARQSNSGGVGYAFLSLGISLAALVLYVPVLAAVLVPHFWIGHAWLSVTVPFAFLYTVGLYFLSLRLTEPWLLEREPEIIARVARPEG